jgi:hypothetical protein
MMYQDKLKEAGHEPERFPGVHSPGSIHAVARGSYLRHLAWMCGTTVQHADNGHIEKAMRWLGFIQGAFWVLGIRTIDEMRDDNTMPEEDPS